MSRPLISLGDALRAFSDLAPQDDETADTILKLLRLHSVDKNSAPSAVGASKPSSTDTATTITRYQSGAPREYVAPARAAIRRLAPNRSRGTARKGVLRTLEEDPSTFQKPQWLEAGAGLDTSPEKKNEKKKPSRKRALFARVHRRGLLSSAISTLDREGEFDIDAMVKVIAAGAALEKLPRKVSVTTRRGVQVLVDRSPALDPYADDQDHLIRALDDILADDRLDIHEFIGCPKLDQEPMPDDESETWRPPPPGVPILALTDLGIAGSPLDGQWATVQEWLDFAHQVRAGKHLLVALVPYEATRCPPQLTRALAVLHWSERTTVGEIRRVMRDARQRLRS